MLDHQTRDKMQKLKLFGMLEALENINQQDANQSITFDVGMCLLVDAENNYRDIK